MSNSILYTDKLLIKELIAGNEKAFLSLFNKYRKEVYAYSLSIVKVESYAEEIVQEVFLKIWLKHKELDQSLSFRAYLIVITKNMSLKTLKKAVNEKKMREDIFYQSQKAFEPVYNKLRDKELEAIKEKAINQLPPRRKLIFELSRIEGMSYEEISKELNISINTVKSQMNKALNSIRSYLLKNDIHLTILVVALI